MGGAPSCRKLSPQEPVFRALPENTAPAPTAAPETPAPTPESAGEEPSRMAVAESFVGGEAAELIAAIGEPISADYASSCLGSGEDGILEYEDFLVYTYRNGESERVDTVLPK